MKVNREGVMGRRWYILLTKKKNVVRLYYKNETVLWQKKPFVISVNHRDTCSRFSKYADPAKREQEEGAYERAVAEKYEITE